LADRVFAILVVLAIVKRGQPAAHKRLMLFATIDTILVACAWHDLRTFKRLHPVTISAGLTLLAFQILRFPIPRMAWWQATYDVLLRLAG
jgi:hypothetical protein